MWFCYCYGAVRVSKHKSECRKDDVLKLCLKKKRKEKLRAMCRSAKVALLGWMIVMVRKFRMGNSPVDWDEKDVEIYLQELFEMWQDLGPKEEGNPSNNTIMDLCSIFMEEFETHTV